LSGVPFTVLTGTFHLVGRTAAGNPSGFEPDGDSMQFKPDQPQLLDTLDQVGRPYKLSAIGSTQLRFEGVDALELHYAGSHQPRPLADDARDYLTGRLGLNPVPYRKPELVRVKPPVQKDGTRGYILTRALEANGRAVAFAFAGESPDPDGADDVFLKPAALKKSLNFRSVENGHAYPLFYDTLFADLRDSLATAAQNARTARKGLWASDRSTSGVSVANQGDLERDGVVFPKLFRRLTAFLDKGQGTLADFPAFLAETREQVVELDANSNFTHFDTLVKVDGGAVSMTTAAEQIVFVSAKPRTTGRAPWLAV
jgi:endonuclease YncB( thermonuclease family)